MTKIAIVGAGSVGSTIAYATMIRGFVREIILIDKDHEKAKAEAMDLNHGAMFVPKANLKEGDLDECRNADVVVVAAGIKQKPGQSRLDLTYANARLFENLIPEVVSRAPDACLLIVSNPVDVLTTLTLTLSGFPPERVIGSGTVLDTSRFRFLLAKRFHVSPNNVHAYIIGEHGDSEVPLWSSAQIGNVPLDRISLPQEKPLNDIEKKEIFEHVRGAAGQVIRAKGATNWAIGLSVANILQAILRDESAILTVSRQLNNYHGVRDVSLSVPWVISRKGATAHLVAPCNDKECTAFHQSAQVVREVLTQLGA